MQKIQYKYKPDNLTVSEPTKYLQSDLKSEEMLINIGPQHPSTHGVLRLEVITDGEIVVDVVPHMGYLHRCFEKHAEALPFNQIIPYVDRLDYAAAMNSEHCYAMGVEKMLGIEHDISKRVEYIRVLVAELSRLASHFLAIGTYALDIGATTPFYGFLKNGKTSNGCLNGFAVPDCYTIIFGSADFSTTYPLGLKNVAKSIWCT